MISEPFFLANATRSVSCLRVAAAPVGLFGEQKKMRSVRLACFFFFFFKRDDKGLMLKPRTEFEE